MTLIDGRYSGLLPEGSRDRNMVIAGLGGVGGHAAIALYRMGFRKMNLWDYDIVEIANVGTQPYRLDDVGSYKTTAINSILHGIEPTTDNRPFAQNLFISNIFDSQTFRNFINMVGGITVVAIDNMGSRKRVVEMIGPQAGKWFVEARMGAEELQIRTVDTGNAADLESWHKSWFPQSEAVNEPCTQRATSYCGMIAGGMIAGIIKNICVGKTPPYFTSWRNV